MIYDTIDNYGVEVVSNDAETRIVAKSKLNPKNIASLNSYFQKNAAGQYEKYLVTDSNVDAVLSLIVGGARIRADMRLRSKQQRRVMNAEFSNGICLA